MLIGNNDFAHDELLPVLNITRDNTTYSFEYNTESKPTSSEHPDADWPFEGYGMLAQTSVAQDMITAQDMAYGAYDEDRYVSFLMRDVHQEFDGLGTGLPARWVQQWYSACYYWPNSTPLPPIGNPNLKGIIAGQIFDPATPYIWTQVSVPRGSVAQTCSADFHL